MSSILYGGLGEIQKSVNDVATTQQQQATNRDVVVCHVLDVITDQSSPYYNYNNGQSTTIGDIRIKPLPADRNVDDASLRIFARPLDRSDYRLPLPGEQVLCIKAFGVPVNDVFTVSYYYFKVVTQETTIVNNIQPYLGGVDAQTRGDIKNTLNTLATDTVANKFQQKIQHNLDITKGKTSIEKLREGDKVLEGRFGGVIKFTSTNEKDTSQRSVFPTKGSLDGDPLLVIKNNRKENNQTLTFNDDKLNSDDVAVYLTTSQNLPIQLGCSKKLYTWNTEKAQGIQKTKEAIGKLNTNLINNAQQQAQALPIDVGTSSQPITPTTEEVQTAISSGNLSKYLTKDKAISSSTAQQNNIPNEPNDQQLNNLISLGLNIYDKICDHFGVTVHINSAFRSVALNTAVGGSRTSQHTKGQALDLDISKSIQNKTNKELFEYIVKNLDYDQVIWEYGDDTQPEWVHVSYDSTKQLQRKDIVRVRRTANGPVYANINAEYNVQRNA